MDATSGVMRWEGLFGDLDQQWSAQERRELDAEVADRTRAERASIGLASRLAVAVAEPVEVLLCTGARLTGPVVDVGLDWVLLGDAVGVQARAPRLVPFAAITSVGGLGRRSSGSGQARRFALGFALRGLSRDRAVVCVEDVGGTATVGTIDAVGADVLDLAMHAADLPRRPENITGRRLVLLAALAVVRPV
jgi:hypothetical protein